MNDEHEPTARTLNYWVIVRLQGREAMNRRNAELHPDLLQRMLSLARAEAYRQAAQDVADIDRELNEASMRARDKSREKAK